LVPPHRFRAARTKSSTSGRPAISPPISTVLSVPSIQFRAAVGSAGPNAASASVAVTARHDRFHMASYGRCTGSCASTCVDEDPFYLRLEQTAVPLPVSPSDDTRPPAKASSPADAPGWTCSGALFGGRPSLAVFGTTTAGNSCRRAESDFLASIARAAAAAAAASTASIDLRRPW